MADKMKKAEETQRIMQALNHPLRRKIFCLASVEDQPVSAASTSRKLGERVANVTYHVKTLSNAGVFELNSTRSVRGAVEHFYVPVPTALAHPVVQALLKEEGAARK